MQWSCVQQNDKKPNCPWSDWSSIRRDTFILALSPPFLWCSFNLLVQLCSWNSFTACPSTSSCSPPIHILFSRSRSSSLEHIGELMQSGKQPTFLSLTPFLLLCVFSQTVPVVAHTIRYLMSWLHCIVILHWLQWFYHKIHILPTPRYIQPTLVRVTLSSLCCVGCVRRREVDSKSWE